MKVVLIHIASVYTVWASRITHPVWVAVIELIFGPQQKIRAGMRRAKKEDRKLISLAGANTISSNEWHFSASCYEARSKRK